MHSSDTGSSHSILKIYAGTSDKIDGRNLFEYIVYKAKEEGVSGATVYRGVMGFGMSSKVHTSKFWELTDKLPVVIELIDTTEQIDRFYKSIEPDLREMPKGCLVIVEPVTVLLHQRGERPFEDSGG